MSIVQLKDKRFEIKIPSKDILKEVNRLAFEINRDYETKHPVFVVVLNGAFMFAGDLVKAVNVNCEITFVKLSSYQGTETTGEVKELIGLQKDIEGRDVIIVEDIVDKGITMEKLLADFLKMKPSSIRIASLLFKPDSFCKDYKVDYVGFEISNDFIVGYGLDYDELGRNLPDIYSIID